MAYQFDSRVRYSEVGEDRRLTIPGIIDYFQDCSTFQSEDIGVGLEILKERKRVWFLASWYLVIDRPPKLGEKITVETWPYNFKGFLGERNFQMKDEAGKPLAWASSVWTYLDLETGHPARVGQEIVDAYILEEALPMEKKSRKISVSKEGGKVQESFWVMRSHLDTNHHVNNGQYILMAQEYLPTGARVKEIRVEYRRQAILHDTIVPIVYEDGEYCTISLCDKEEKPYAVVEFKLTL